MLHQQQLLTSKTFASGVMEAKSRDALEMLKGNYKPAILCQLYYALAKSHLKESFQTYMSAGTSLLVSCSVLCKLLAYQSNVSCSSSGQQYEIMLNYMLYLF